MNAIEDAIVLSNCIYEMGEATPANITAAFKEYREERYPNVKKMMDKSALMAALQYGQVKRRVVRVPHSFVMVLTENNCLRTHFPVFCVFAGVFVCVCVRVRVQLSLFIDLERAGDSSCHLQLDPQERPDVAVHEGCRVQTTGDIPRADREPWDLRSTPTEAVQALRRGESGKRNCCVGKKTPLEIVSCRASTKVDFFFLHVSFQLK